MLSRIFSAATALNLTVGITRHPSAKSVIVCAMGYPLLPPAGGEFETASAVRSFDYHEVLRKKLETLAESLPPCRYEIRVDDSNLPERNLAIAAGVGYRCKNGCIAAPPFGSACVIGEILTDLDLPFSRPLRESCGSCDLCAKACPAGAVGDPQKKICVSALTQASHIPDELKPLIDKNLYGCDICLRVCPKNKVVDAPDAGFYDFPLSFLITVTKKDFEERVKPTPIGYLGISRLRRNAIIIAANTNRVDLIDAIAAAPADSPRVADAVKYALKKLSEIRQ